MNRGLSAEQLGSDDRAGTVVRIEPGETRGWDFRDAFEAMGELDRGA